MDAHSQDLAGLFNHGGGVQYMLPYFQRQYTWEEKDWQALFSDIILLCNDKNHDDSTEHFMGSIVTVNSGLAGSAPRYTLIDGQQRLITISLLLKALSAVGTEELQDKLPYIDSLLRNSLEKGDSALKVLPCEKNHDRAAFAALVGGASDVPDGESGVHQAYDFFVDSLEGMRDDHELDLPRFLDAVVRHLMFIRIETTPDDKPYRIFESLNGRGVKLTQGDLVRNYVAMRLPDPADQDEVFKGSWGTIDSLLDDSREVGRSGMRELTAFIRHYLAATSRVLYEERNVYEEFRNYAEHTAKDPATFKQLIARVARYAGYYDQLLRPAHESDQETGSLLSSLSLFDQSASYPFLLEAYDALSSGLITRRQFNRMLEVLGGYFVRRFLCGYPTNYATKQLPNVWQEVGQSPDPVEALRTALGARKCPTDDEIAEEVLHFRLYPTPRATTRISHVLFRLSIEADPGIDVHPVVSPTLEHIMPQTLTRVWRQQLGDDADEVNTKYGDTLANLTLIPQDWNSSLSNGPFNEKRSVFRTSKLPLNYVFFERIGDTWNVEQLKKRGQWLAELVGRVYPEFPRIEPVAVASGDAPKYFKLDGDVVSVASWRDITTATVLYIIDRGKFDSAKIEAPTYFKREEDQLVWPPRWRKLPNGWRVFTAFGRLGTARFCKRLLVASGLVDVAWSPMFEKAADDTPEEMG